MTVLRPELLNGQTVVIAGDEGGQLTAALAALGATVIHDRSRTDARALVYDVRPEFGAGGEHGLRAGLDAAWQAVSEVANAALIPAGETGTAPPADRRPAKIVLIGPRPDAGAFAEAARAGLENLARTLSVEWARYGITTVMVAPGVASTEEALAELVCFLVSPGGEYLTGCRLELGAMRQSEP
jgi:NAD(P)-dependent dehydrogenase (short-subunit alcohol dehydrogenase family)